jgi:hypothetical protein
MQEAVRTSEASVYFNKTTRCCVPEDYYIDINKAQNCARAAC